MRITWVTRSFLDYRIPIYEEINRLCDNQLTVIFFDEVVPERCKDKLKTILGDRAIGLSGELRLTGKKHQPLSKMKRDTIRIPFQPGLIRTIINTKPQLLLSDGFFQWTYAPILLNAFLNIPHLMLYEGTKHTERNAGNIRTLYRKMASRFMNFISCNGSLSAEY